MPREKIESSEEFRDSYVETALWASLDGDKPMDEDHTRNDLDPETLDKMIEDCDDFYSRAHDLWEDNDDRHAGHDFWLTRNHHGAGFWDGDYENGNDLTNIANEYGQCDLYVGDDGMIYLG